MSVRIATAFAAGIGGIALILGGSAPAQAQEMAAGLNCDGLTCTNDGDDSYVVSGVTYCLTNPATTPQTPGQLPSSPTPYQNSFSGVVPPHGSVALTPMCRGGDSMTGWALTGAAPGTGMPGTGSG
ncbi:hypothetical protein [Nocardia heshunensis]